MHTMQLLCLKEENPRVKSGSKDIQCLITTYSLGGFIQEKWGKKLVGDDINVHAKKRFGPCSTTDQRSRIIEGNNGLQCT